FIIDWSADAEDHYSLHDDIKVVLLLLRPFLLLAEVISAENFDALYQQALLEMDSPDFVAMMLYVTAWGKTSK
ncbi:MAG TPA: hypothetical protein VJQ26_00075, partial [Ktedonobacteraceae bacterium]|nr:hypothetical protein [Ktedonobacteraceae bacterium]